MLTSEDHPEVVSEALRYSIRLANEGRLSARDPWLWKHNAQNSYETIEDAFRTIDGELLDPDARAMVFMAPDHLEEVLVGYGIDGERSEDELAQIDALLTSIDGLKRQVAVR